MRLPDEIWRCCILPHLDFADMVALCAVSKGLRDACGASMREHASNAFLGKIRSMSERLASAETENTHLKTVIGAIDLVDALATLGDALDNEHVWEGPPEEAADDIAPDEGYGTDTAASMSDATDDSVDVTVHTHIFSWEENPTYHPADEV